MVVRVVNNNKEKEIDGACTTNKLRRNAYKFQSKNLRGRIHLPDAGVDGKVIYHRLKKNSAALFRRRTIPTDRPPLVGEVNANFSG
jgi:hypothetical protein